MRPSVPFVLTKRLPDPMPASKQMRDVGACPIAFQLLVVIKHTRVCKEGKRRDAKDCSKSANILVLLTSNDLKILRTSKGLISYERHT